MRWPVFFVYLRTMELIEPIWKGIATGLMFTITFGTVFFSLIQTSVKRGLREGLYIASGVVLSDGFYITVAVLGSSFLVDGIEEYQQIIRGIGFTFLLVLGIRSIVKKEAIHTEENPIPEKKGILYMMKGMLLNSVNPMVLFAWLGVATYVKTVNHFDFNQVVLFFAIVLGTMFSSMFGICYFARKLKNVLSPQNMHRLNMLSGIIFIVFSLVIIWPVLAALV
jgi:L-lysine exporter family protein LysE/ArgO